MKFKIGDKVKYDSGEWLMCGSVNAIFDHSINPCYRINVDKMIKKSCNLSMTQFEFELDADDEATQAVAEIAKNDVLIEKIYTKLEAIENATAVFQHEIEESKRLNRLMDDALEKQSKRGEQPKKIVKKGRRGRVATQKQELEQEQVVEVSPSTVVENVAEIIDVPVEVTEETAKKRRGGRRKKDQEQAAASGAVTKESVAETVEKQDDVVVVNEPGMKKKIGRPKKKKAAPAKKKGGRPKKIQEQAAASGAVANESVAETIEKQDEAAVGVELGMKKKMGRPRKIEAQAPVEKKTPAWYINFEKFKSGERSNVISAWAAQNRKEYKSGKLKEKKLDLLLEVDFPFEITSRKKVVS